MAYSKKEIKSIFEKILFEMVVNGKSLRTVLKMDSMPDITTFYIWIEKDEIKSKQYAQAIKMRADLLFDEMLDIADDNSKDFIDQELAEGIIVSKFDHEHVQRSRLRIDTRKWVIERMNAKKYNEKYIELEEKESDSSNKIEVTIVRKAVEEDD